MGTSLSCSNQVNSPSEGLQENSRDCCEYNSLATPENTITYHNTLCWPQNCSHKHCFQFILGHFNSQEKLKTMLMQNFGVANKEYYGMYIMVFSGVVHTVPDPELEMRGWGGRGSGHPDPEIRGRAVFQKCFFGPSGISMV